MEVVRGTVLPEEQLPLSADRETLSASVGLGRGNIKKNKRGKSPSNSPLRVTF